MAQAVLRPAVMDFIELATKSEHLELQIEETEILTGSSLAGQSLKDSAVRQDLGIIIVAIKKPVDGRMLFNPAPHTVIVPPAFPTWPWATWASAIRPVAEIFTALIAG
jgi:voltage-gated potassium channel